MAAATGNDKTDAMMQIISGSLAPMVQAARNQTGIRLWLSSSGGASDESVETNRHRRQHRFGSLASGRWAVPRAVPSRGIGGNRQPAASAHGHSTLPPRLVHSGMERQQPTAAPASSSSIGRTHLHAGSVPRLDRLRRVLHGRRMVVAELTQLTLAGPADELVPPLHPGWPITSFGPSWPDHAETVPRNDSRAL